jgi:hypothetical protein
MTIENISRALHTVAARRRRRRAWSAHPATAANGRKEWRRSQPTALRSGSCSASNSTPHARTHLSCAPSDRLSSSRRSSSSTFASSPPHIYANTYTLAYICVARYRRCRAMRSYARTAEVAQSSVYPAMSPYLNAPPYARTHKSSLSLSISLFRSLARSSSFVRSFSLFLSLSHSLSLPPLLLQPRRGKQGQGRRVEQGGGAGGGHALRVTSDLYRRRACTVLLRNWLLLKGRGRCAQTPLEVRHCLSVRADFEYAGV